MQMSQQQTLSKDDDSPGLGGDSPLTTWVLNLNNSIFTEAEDELDKNVLPPWLEPLSTTHVATAITAGSKLPAEPHRRCRKCQPCVFLSSPTGCPLAQECGYCHQDHALPPLKQRVRKRTRDKTKEKLWEIVHSQLAFEEMHHQLQMEAQRHPFARGLIQAFLQDPVNFVW